MGSVLRTLSPILVLMLLAGGTVPGRAASSSEPVRSGLWAEEVKQAMKTGTDPGGRSGAAAGPADQGGGTPAGPAGGKDKDRDDKGDKGEKGGRGEGHGRN